MCQMSESSVEGKTELEEKGHLVEEIKRKRDDSFQCKKQKQNDRLVFLLAVAMFPSHGRKETWCQ